MSCRGGVKLALLIGLTLFGAAVALVWMALLPWIVANRIEAVTGFPTRIDRLVANPFTGRATVEGLVIDSPPTFRPATFLVVNEFQADLQLFTLFRETVVFDEVRLDLARAVIVTNTDGTNNLDLFKSRWPGKRVERANPSDAPPRWLVHRLELAVGTIELINLNSRAPSQRKLELDFAYSYRDVSSVKQLMVPALLRRMAVAGGSFEGLLPDELGETLGGWIGEVGGVLGGIGRKATDTLKSLFEKLEESTKP